MFEKIFWKAKRVELEWDVPSERLVLSFTEICGSQWNRNREPKSSYGVWKKNMNSNFWCRIDHVPGNKIIWQIFLLVNSRWVCAEIKGRKKNKYKEVWKLTFGREYVSVCSLALTLSNVKSWEIHLCVCAQMFVSLQCTGMHHSYSAGTPSLCLCWLDQARLRS